MFYSKKITASVDGGSVNVDEGVETVDGGSVNVDEGVETVSSLKPSPAGVRGTSPRSSRASSSLSDDAFAPEVDATVNER